MKKIIDDICKWQDETFPVSDSSSKFNHLLDEISELQTALMINDKENISEELADCVILLIGIAGKEKVDLEIAILAKMETNKKRVWGLPDELGVVNHVKDSV